MFNYKIEIFILGYFLILYFQQIFEPNGSRQMIDDALI